MVGGEDDEPGNLWEVVGAFSVNLRCDTKTRICFFSFVFLMFSTIDSSSSSHTLALDFSPFYFPVIDISERCAHRFEHSGRRDGRTMKRRLAENDLGAS